jgi:hypothetical protein
MCDDLNPIDTGIESQKTIVSALVNQAFLSSTGIAFALLVLFDKPSNALLSQLWAVPPRLAALIGWPKLMTSWDVEFQWPIGCCFAMIFYCGLMFALAALLEPPILWCAWSICSFILPAWFLLFPLRAPYVHRATSLLNTPDPL